MVRGKGEEMEGSGQDFKRGAVHPIVAGAFRTRRCVRVYSSMRFHKVSIHRGFPTISFRQ